jgi:hypothetical protein
MKNIRRRHWMQRLLQALNGLAYLSIALILIFIDQFCIDLNPTTEVVHGPCFPSEFAVGRPTAK